MTMMTQDGTQIYGPVPKATEEACSGKPELWAHAIAAEASKMGFAALDPIWLARWTEAIHNDGYEQGKQAMRPYRPGGD